MSNGIAYVQRYYTRLYPRRRRPLRQPCAWTIIVLCNKPLHLPAEGVTRAMATRWVAGTDYEVQRVSADQDNITVIIVGRGTQPSFADLEAGLKTALRRPVIVTLEIVPVEKIVSQ